MKNFLILCFMVLSMKVYGQASPAVIYNAGYGKVIPQFGLRFNDNKTLISGSADPSAVATDAPIGSIYISSNGLTYQKQDNGSSTNWTRLYFVPVFTDDNRLVRTDGTDNVQQSGITVSDLDAVTGVSVLEVGNLSLSANSIISTDTNGDINLTPNGLGEVELQAPTVIDGLRVDDYIISSVATDQAIELNPNGTGTVDVPYLSNGGIVFGGSNGALIEDIANFSYASIDERLSVNNATIGNIGVSANTISSTNTDGNIVLDPNGTGDVLVDTLTHSRVVFSDAKALSDDSQFTYDSATKKLRVDGLDLGGVNTITTHSGNNDLILTAHGTGEIELQKPTLIDDLKVTGQEITGQVVDGDIDITANGTGEINLNSPVNIGDLQIDNDAITNTVLDGNVALVPNGTGDAAVVYGTNELDLDPQLQKASIISNGSFERGITGVTCTNATASSEDTVVVNAENNNLSLRIVTDGSVDWSCDIPLKGGMVGGEQFFYSLFSNTSLQTVEVCLFNGTIERNCQELKGISDWYEFYSGLNQAFATNNAIRIKGADSEATGTVYADLVDAQLGLPKIGPSKNCANELDCENVFSATVDGTVSPSVVSNLNVDGWIDDCTRTGTGVYTCPAVGFSEIPNCTATAIQNTGDGASIVARFDRTSSSTTVLHFATGTTGGSKINAGFNIVCQKAAPDFKSITEQGVVVTGQAQGADFSAYRATSQTIGNATVTFQPSNIVTSDLFSWDGANFEATALSSGKFESVFRALSYNPSSGASYVYFLEVDTGSGFALVSNNLPCSNETSDSNSRRNSINCNQLLSLQRGNKVRLRMTSNHASSSIFQNTIMQESGAWSIRSVLDRQTIMGDLETRYSTIPSAAGLHASVQGGVEEQTGDKWDGKVIYRRCYEVTANITATTTLHTIETNLDPVNAPSISRSFTSRFYIDFTAVSGSNAGELFYDRSAGTIQYNIVSATFSLNEGYRFCLKYTKP